MILFAAQRGKLKINRCDNVNNSNDDSTCWGINDISRIRWVELSVVHLLFFFFGCFSISVFAQLSVPEVFNLFLISYFFFFASHKLATPQCLWEMEYKWRILGRMELFCLVLLSAAANKASTSNHHHFFSISSHSPLFHFIVLIKSTALLYGKETGELAYHFLEDASHILAQWGLKEPLPNSIINPPSLSPFFSLCSFCFAKSCLLPAGFHVSCHMFCFSLPLSPLCFWSRHFIYMSD